MNLKDFNNWKSSQSGKNFIQKTNIEHIEKEKGIITTNKEGNKLNNQNDINNHNDLNEFEISNFDFLHDIFDNQCEENNKVVKNNHNDNNKENVLFII